MSLKRKAAHASLPQVDTPDNKRRRGPDQAIANVVETPQRTTQVGLEFLDRLRQSKDKQGHLIATHFLVLPNPNELPDYYQVIQMPISLETIEAKLRRYEYPNMSAIEGDLKRAISNAKTYNQKGSEVHDDAEKIRKLVSNSFKDINPAYADPAYTALPTPLPGEPGYSQPTYSHPLAQSLAPGTPTPTANPRSTERPKRSLNLRGPKDPRVRDSQTPTALAPAPSSAAAGDLVGKTFQQAQEEILQELCELTNEDGELISGNFLQLPSRSLKDYYHTIKTPESLHGLKKKAVGKQGHAEPTGISLMKSWADFENQVSLIWRNARQYNEDGSEISVLAGQLEKHFNKRLAEAKAVIPDPNRPKVKLNMPAKSPDPPASNPKITLNLGHRASAGGVSVDTDALKRQQEMIKSVTNVPTRQDPPLQAAVPPALAQSPMPASNGIKAEVSTPGLPPVTPAGPEMNGSLSNGHGIAGMPPPALIARPHSGSPFPPPAPQYHMSHSSGAFETRVRAHGKTAADALIQSLEVSTHPSIQIPAEDKIAYTFTPSDRLTQQSFTFSVSPAHSFLRLRPTIQQAAAQRTTKLGVLFQGHKVLTAQQQYQQEVGEDDPQRPMYDIPLRDGEVNRIEVWMLAGPARGAPKVGGGIGAAGDVEFEKYTLFVWRMKA